jgi:hypothetical protein
MKLLPNKIKPAFIGGVVYLGWGNWIRSVGFADTARNP